MITTALALTIIGALANLVALVSLAVGVAKLDKRVTLLEEGKGE